MSDRSEAHAERVKITLIRKVLGAKTFTHLGCAASDFWPIVKEMAPEDRKTVIDAVQVRKRELLDEMYVVRGIALE